jgi:hypothetical protein
MLLSNLCTYTPRYQAAHLHGLLLLDRSRRGGARTGGGLRIRGAAQDSDTGPVLESRIALAECGIEASHTLAAGFLRRVTLRGLGISFGRSRHSRS